MDRWFKPGSIWAVGSPWNGITETVVTLYYHGVGMKRGHWQPWEMICYN